MNSLFVSHSPAKLIALTSFLSILVIASLSFYIHSNVTGIINDQIDSAAKIDISGYQRMLSQRSAFFTTEYAKTQLPDDKIIAAESIALLQQRHELLISEFNKVNDEHGTSIFSEELAILYFEPPISLDSYIQDYIAFIENILENPETISDSKLNKLKSDSQKILEKLDIVVQQYESESKVEISKLTELQNRILIVIILLLLIQVFAVTRPLLKIADRLSSQLKDEANRDYLTGLYNRRILPVLAEQIISISKRGDFKVSVVLFDIDNFKRINDTNGHSAGDKVIQSVADAIKSGSREADEAFRYGGEEFLLLLPQTDVDGAMEVAEKIRKSIEALSEAHKLCSCDFTISGGIATLGPDEDTLEAALSRADKALYQAKALDKNNNVIAE